MHSNGRRGRSQGTAGEDYSVRDGLLSDVILSLAAAPNGDLWVGTPDGLNRIRGGRIDPSPRPTGCRTTSSARCWWTPMGRCGLGRGAG
jgi:ligand-binding sensor domain-containing protein